MKILIVLVIVAVTLRGEASLEEKSNGSVNDDAVSNEDTEPDEDIAPSQTQQSENVDEDNDERIRIEARTELESVAYGLVNEFKDKTKFGGTIAYDSVKTMEDAAISAIEWLKENQDAELEDYIKQKQKLLKTVETLMSKLILTAATASPINAETEGEATSESTDERTKVRNELKNTATTLKKQFSDKSKFTESAYEDIKSMQNAAVDTLNWLDENQDADIEDILNQKKILLNTVESLMSKIFASASGTPSINVPTEEAKPDVDDEATENNSEDKQRKERIQCRNELEKAAWALKAKLKDKTEFVGSNVYDSLVEMELAADDAIKWLDENKDADLGACQQQKIKLSRTVEALVKKIKETADATEPTNVPTNKPDNEDKAATENESTPLESKEDISSPTDEAEPVADDTETKSESMSESETEKAGSLEDRVKARHELEKTANTLKNQFKDMQKFAGTAAFDGVKAMDEAANDALKWLDENDDADLEEYIEQNKKLLQSMETLISKIMQGATDSLMKNVPKDEAKLPADETETESDSTEDIDAEDDDTPTPPTSNGDNSELRDEL